MKSKSLKVKQLVGHTSRVSIVTKEDFFSIKQWAGWLKDLKDEKLLNANIRYITVGLDDQVEIVISRGKEYDIV